MAFFRRRGAEPQARSESSLIVPPLWTTLGVVGDTERPLVDRAGRVAPSAYSWTIDWWIGGDDQWYRPSEQAAVRQRRMEDVPVVETAMRISGGDALHRAYAIVGPPTGLVIEVENDTSVPFAVCLVLSPSGLLADQPISEVTIDGAVLSIDGAPVLVGPKSPSLLVGGTDPDGIFEQLVSGKAGGPVPPSVSSASGATHVAVIWPVAHRTDLRFVVPLGDLDAETAAEISVGVGAIPPAAMVASGWRSQLHGGAHMIFPDPRLQETWDRTRTDVMLAHRGRNDAAGVAGGSAADGRAESVAAVARSFARLGLVEEAADVLMNEIDPGPPVAQFVGIETDRAGASFLSALADLLQLDPDPELAKVLAEPVDTSVSRLVSGIDAMRPSTVFSALAGLETGQRLLTVRGDRRGVERLQKIRTEVEVENAPGADADGVALADASAIVRTWWLTHVVGVDHESVVAAVAGLGAAPAEQVVGFDEHGVADPIDTIALAGAEISAGSVNGHRRLIAMLDRASSTGIWPSRFAVDGGPGPGGVGHDLAVSAHMVELLTRTLVDDGPDGISFCPTFPTSWLGASIECHDLHTRFGMCSFAIRWHAERPALLWEIETGGHEPPPIIRAPGIDPSWSTTELKGEALLQAPAAASE